MKDIPDIRPDPDLLLPGLHQEGEGNPRGRLHIFLGMCPGVGKTVAMLKTAHQRQAEGVTVLAGVVETHGREETARLLEGLDILPRRSVPEAGVLMEEFDPDAALQARPGLLLVDELAHTNAPGSRHAKRWQDVLELTAAGIDVHTTLNVQHIESQVDVVRQITGVQVMETVPDFLLDQADSIEIIDLSVEQLRARLAAGRIYQGERAEAAMEHFFRVENLTALRELALRFTAGLVDRDLEQMRRRRRIRAPWKTNARLLVGAGPSPYAESLIRWTRRTAMRLDCPWIVAWVEGPRLLTKEEQELLTRALALARRLGAEVVTIPGGDVAAALLGLGAERNVTQIVVGKPGGHRWPWRPSLADRLIRDSGDMEICVVRPEPAGGPFPGAAKDTSVEKTEPVSASTVGEYSWSVVLALVLVSAGQGVLPWTGYGFVGLAFLLAVVLAALRLSRGPVLLLAALCALSWDYFFIEPRFTLRIGQAQDLIMFGMFFIVALSMGHLTSRLRERERTGRRRYRETAALLRVTQSAALSRDPDQGIREALEIIGTVLDAGATLIPRRPDAKALSPEAHSAGSFQPSAREWGVAGWAFQNRQPAGRHTATLPQSSATWFPLRTRSAVMGVLGIRLGEKASLDFVTRRTVEAFALQLALVLEKEEAAQAAARAGLLAESSRLQRALLDSVSHELKTPLAVIHAALDHLSGPGPAGTEAGAAASLEEIRAASRRLQRVVDHLLQMTRLESAAVLPVPEWCLPGDLAGLTVELADISQQEHPLHVDTPADLPAVRLDPHLTAQAAANILHNAAFHTPPGTPVELSVRVEPSPDGPPARLVLRIADRGPGLPPGSGTRVFEKFHRAPGSRAGGTGLGLAIALALIRAQGGTIVAANRPDGGGGAEFTLTLPVETEASLLPHDDPGPPRSGD